MFQPFGTSGTCRRRIDNPLTTCILHNGELVKMPRASVTRCGSGYGAVWCDMSHKLGAKKNPAFGGVNIKTITLEVKKLLQ